MRLQYKNMHRFFIPPEWIDQNDITLKGTLVHQLRDVLRLQKGNRIAVLDNTGFEYEVELTTVTRELIAGVICDRKPVMEPGTRITLYQALLKSRNFEFVLQKCTELGVSCFVPTLCERSVASYPKDSRRERWQKIILESAEQSGRGKLPLLNATSTFQDAFKSAAGLTLILIPTEGEQTVHGLRAVLQDNRALNNPLEVSLFIGPEGGFSRSEVAFAKHQGIVPVSLGTRVLRAETAGLVAATAILYELGDLDPKALKDDLDA